MANKAEIITKGELKFWLAIIAVILSGVIAFTKLQDEVQAMTSREQSNKQSFSDVVNDLLEIKDLVIEIKVNQKHIMRELGIE